MIKNKRLLPMPGEFHQREESAEIAEKSLFSLSKQDKSHKRRDVSPFGTILGGVIQER